MKKFIQLDESTIICLKEILYVIEVFNPHQGLVVFKNGERLNFIIGYPGDWECLRTELGVKSL